VLQEVWYYNDAGTTNCFTRPVGSLALMYVKKQSGRIKALGTIAEGLCSLANGIHYYECTPTSEHDVAGAAVKDGGNG
jgi:cob(I)alamin adenosyltransferase